MAALLCEFWCVLLGLQNEERFYHKIYTGTFLEEGKEEEELGETFGRASKLRAKVGREGPWDVWVVVWLLTMVHAGILD